MSIHKDEQLPIKEKTFLGKKINSPIQINALIEINNPNIKQCKICENKNYINKCSKCLNYLCNECTKKRAHIKHNNLKEFICPDCINNNNLNITCYICGYQFLQ